MNQNKQEKMASADRELTRDEFIHELAEEKSLDQILGVSPDEVAYMKALGFELFEQGRMDDALTIFEGIQSIGHADPFVLMALGTLMARKGALETARSYFDKVLLKDPNSINALVNRAEISLKENKFDDAALDLKKAILLDPDDANPIAARARALVLVTHELMQSLEQRV